MQRKETADELIFPHQQHQQIAQICAPREIAISPWRTEAIAREQLCSISKIKEPQSSLCGIKLKIVRALVVYENVCGLLPPIHAPERIFIDPGTYIASQGRSILADTTFSYCC
jgi:hypothetical protein